jgi:hypothetical protein
MEIEWLILADAAQVVNGKLYLLGGGWETVTLHSDRFPVSHHCAVAASFRVPWLETNQQTPMEIEIVHEDGDTIAKIAGQVEVGRPAGHPPGQDQRTQLATELALALPKPGNYVVIGRIAGEEKKRVPFRVILNPMLATQQSKPGAA